MSLLKYFSIVAFIVCCFSENIQAQANFNIGITNNGCQIATYQFTDASGGGTPAYDRVDWDFGNGNISLNNAPLSNQSASYNGIGFYTVKMTLMNGGAFVTIAQKNVIVYKNPSPAFTANQVSGCTDYTVNFTDQSITTDPLVGTVVQRIWSYGDGTTETYGDGINPTALGQNPVHTYTNPGDFQVSLILKTRSPEAVPGVANQPVCTAPNIKTKYIKVRYSPVADFVQTAFNCNAPLNATEITYSSTSTVASFPPPAGKILSYEWKSNGVILGTNSSITVSFITTATYGLSLTVTTEDGCVNTKTASIPITINSNNFTTATASGSNVCQDVAINFTGVASSGTPTSWAWSFGDGNTASIQNPAHTYLTTGSKTVNLVTGFADGCFKTATQTLNVLPSPVATFTANKTSFCATGTATFSPSTVVAANTYEWSFYDQNNNFVTVYTRSGASPNQNYTYNTDGDYRVSLKVTNPNGCFIISNVPNYISFKKPNAKFSLIGSRQSCVNGTIQLAAGLPIVSSPNDPINSYQWTFTNTQSPFNVINVNTAAVPNISQLFSVAGVYNAQLQVSSPTGCTDTFVTANLIQIAAPPATPTLTVTDNRGGGVTCRRGAGDTGINFSFTIPSDADSAILDYGDGVKRTVVGTGTNFTTSNYLPTISGNLTPSLIVFKFGCPTTGNGAGYTVTNPIARFSPNAGACAGGATITFNNNSLQNAGTNYVWDYGDGVTFNAATPIDATHTYSAAGTYLVRLTATDGGGCSDYIEKLVYVAESVTNFTVAPNAGCGTVDNPLTVLFSNIPNSSVITQWKWDFDGDGNFDQTRTDANNFTRNFTVPNNTAYATKLQIIQSNGCVLDFTRFITVNGPIPNFTTAYNTGLAYACTNNAVDFADASQYVPATSTNAGYLWDFGDGGGGITVNNGTATPKHTYTSSGTYTVSLRVTDNNGCNDRAIKTMKMVVQTSPVASFTTAKSIECTENTVLFTNNSTSSSLNFWTVTEQNGTVSTFTTTNLPYKFQTDGFHTVTLVAQNANGCKSVITRNIRTITPEIRVKASDGVEGALGITTVSAEKLNGQTLITAVKDGVNLTGVSSLAFSCPPGQVNFKASLTSAAAFTTVTTWYWDFGDGNTAFSQNPTHTYLLPGSYEVNLIANTQTGCMAKIPVMTGLITVNGPIGKFDFHKKNICYADEVTFTGYALKKFKSIEWDFGDGTTSGVIYLTPAEYALAEAGTILAGKTQISHVYDQPGVFFPFMILNDENNCKIAYPSEFGPVRSSGNPKALFGTSVGTQICTNLGVNFLDASTPDNATKTHPRANQLGYDIVKWEWHYGINGTGLGNSFTTGNAFDYVSNDPTHPSQTISYEESGFYTVTLKTTT
ncbi:MAG: PKD domain-containing protein, partial [Bacteroidetes bacterium]